MAQSIADDEVSYTTDLGSSEEWVDYSNGQPIPLRPVRIPEWEWLSHPLLSRAVSERWIVGDEIRPTGLEEAQSRALEKLHIVVEHGERVVSMPPRFNADAFVDGVDVNGADDLIGGLHPDLDRFYFRCAQPSGDYIETYAAVSDGRRRRFFATQYGPLWVEVDARAFARRLRDESSTMTEVTRHGIHAFERQLMAQFGLAYHIADKNPLNPVWSRFLHHDLPRTTGAIPVVADVVPRGAHVAEPVEAVPVEAASGSHAADAVASVAVLEHSAPAAPATALEHVEPADIDVPPAEFDDEAVVPRDEVAALVQLARASAIATVVHRGQTDLTGAPYIDHPARIADTFDPIEDAVAASVAWLHDVLEDTDLTETDLRDAGVEAEVIEAIVLLTRRADVPDDEYYRRIRANEVALRVKLADIDDNTAPWRLRRLDDADRERLTAKYDAARAALA